MARTASSVHATAAATANQPSAQSEALGIIWSCVLQLWRIGHRYERLVTASAKLDRQLGQSDAAQREGYIEALARYSRWTAELQGHDMHIATLIGNLAKHYGKLSQRQRALLISNPGWSQSADPQRFANEMWERARRREKYPLGEPPFDQTDLGMWLDNQMARARQQIAADVAQWFRTMHGQEAA